MLMVCVSITVVWEIYLTLFVYFDVVLTPRQKLIAYFPAMIPSIFGGLIYGVYKLKHDNWF